MFWSDTATGAGTDVVGDGVPGEEAPPGPEAEQAAEPSVAAEPEPARPADDTARQVAADEEFLAAMASEFDAIEAALVRLDEGNFDTCQVCGARIGQDRLMADPLITRCPDHS